MVIFLREKNVPHVLKALRTMLEETSDIGEFSLALIETISEIEREQQRTKDRKETVKASQLTKE